MIRHIAAAALVVSATPALAQFIPSEESLSGMYPGKAYSPYAERSFPDRVFWGDTHLHTELSMDAGLFGARLGLEDAYRFARGEQVMASSGQPAKLGRPLDWLVIADHSDGLGLFTDLAAGEPSLLKFDQARPWYEGLQAGGTAAAEAALNLITTFAQGEIDPEMMAEYSPGGKTYESVWEHVVDAAERFNDPGSFTTIIGFEWTSLVAGNNLHRNVLFREGAEKAGRVVPYTTQAPIGSTDPLDLYAWLENYEATTGGSALAIAHNGNLSNGLMFPVDAQYTGRDDRRDLCRGAGEVGAALRDHPDQGRRRGASIPVAGGRVRELRDLGCRQPRPDPGEDAGDAAIRIQPAGVEERPGSGSASSGPIPTSSAWSARRTATPRSRPPRRTISSARPATTSRSPIA